MPISIFWKWQQEGVGVYMSRKNSIIFTNKKHTEKGIMASILGVISLMTLAYSIVVSYRNRGDVPLQYGVAVLLAMLFSLIGVILGIISKSDRDCYYVFSYMGIVLNALALAIVSMILYAGAYGIA